MGETDKPNNTARIVLGVLVALVLAVILAVILVPKDNSTRVSINLLLVQAGMMSNQAKYIEFSNPTGFNIKSIDLDVRDSLNKMVGESRMDIHKIVFEPPSITLSILDDWKYKGPYPTRITIPFIAPALISRIVIKLLNESKASGTVISLKNESGYYIYQSVIGANENQTFGINPLSETVSSDNSTPTPGPDGGVGGPDVANGGETVAVVDIPLSKPNPDGTDVSGGTITPPPPAPVIKEVYNDVRGVDTIEFIKVTPDVRVMPDGQGGFIQPHKMPVGENPDWRTFALAEVQAFDLNGNLLKADAYVGINTTSGDAAIFNPNKIIDGDENSWGGTYNQDEGYGGTQVHRMILKLKRPTLLSRIRVVDRKDCHDMGTICKTRLNNVMMYTRRRNNDIIDGVKIATGYPRDQTLTLNTDFYNILPV